MIKSHFALILCILFSCILVSCDSGGDSSSSSNIVPSNGSIDPQLKADLDVFLAEAAARNIPLNQDRLNNLTIIFDDLEDDTLALCTVRSDGSNLIQISNILKGGDSTFTTVHELGHCVLRMEHRDGVLSIMNSRSSDAQLKQLPIKQVYDEFFTERFFEAY